MDILCLCFVIVFLMAYDFILFLFEHYRDKKRGDVEYSGGPITGMPIKTK